MLRLHLIITGRVQGVGFRAGAQREAGRLGLNGWVKNLSNGASVESVVEGEEEFLKSYENWCHRGPGGAHITDVNARWLPATGEFKNFSFKF